MGSGSPGGFASPPAGSAGSCSVPVHIELTEMLRCPERHEEAFLVMSTGEMVGRMVRSGILGCPVCRKEYPIVKGIVNFSGGEGTPLRDKNTQSLRGVPSPPDAETLQALLDLSGPGGYVVLVGSAARHFTLSVGVSSPDSIVKSRSINTTFFGISNFARSRKPPTTSRSIFACTSGSASSSAREV